MNQPTTTGKAGRGTDQPVSPWADSLGRSSIRAAQIIMLLAPGVVIVRALAHVQLVIIPILLALILAAAIGPFVIWLREKG
ncbi:putative PurR-regulated permease PerM [Arthrobacter sp. CAN_A6]|uniref:hypothetical protein n=1 Tax=Arthrobacter sp. CAN_A6 TaxID=2787721 RepID=UPI001A1B6909